MLGSSLEQGRGDIDSQDDEFACVVIAEDNPVMRLALADLFELKGAPRLVGVASGVSEVLELIARLRPSVAVVDVRMPDGGAPYVARQARKRYPDTKILAFSADDAPSVVLEMLRSGAAGYLLKDSTSDEIFRAIRQVAGGGRVLSPVLTGPILGEVGESFAHEEKMLQEAAQRREAVAEILAGQHLEMVFQPIYALERRAIAGAEALARISHEPQRGPAEWFAEAAEVGLLPDLELMALQEAMKAFGTPRAERYLSVNLSPSTIPAALDTEALGEGSVEGIVIEITEHEQIDDYQTLRESLAGFRARGGRLSIDDAGAGYSSLRHILELNPDFIKLDLSLTAGIETDRSRRALAAGLISFAKVLGATVIAEGIETAGQLAILVGLGVAFGQGYHLARPGGVDQLDD